ncbi:MAG: discoidin domain-containing protein [Salinivirgaceae bacterium]|jgi:endoglucanase Acf2|nr:discoidin domain-containing protein [Salinivirgaceae bacterium]
MKQHMTEINAVTNDLKKNERNLNMRTNLKRMKNLLNYNLLKNLVFLFLATSIQTYAQTPITVGSGSYASFPPAEELEFEWEGVTYYNDYDFVYNNTIYVADGESRPIPTNDWWTNILVEQYGGLLFAYPLVMQPTAEGLNIQYPNGFNASGSNLDRGEGIKIKAEGYTPDKAIASDWSDWLVEMQLPDASSESNMTVTMAHGIPFTYIETEGINPIITASAGASYFTSNGDAVTFPVTSGESFILSSEGRLFGIHLGDEATANVTGLQYLTVDLGANYALSSINLLWETAFASGYQIQVSNDNTNWTTIQTVTNGNGGTDNLALSGNGRYVRILLTEQGTIYAYSLFEVEIYSGLTNVSINKTALASSTQTGFTPALAIDGNTGTRWASETSAEEKLVISMNGNNHFVVSALKSMSDLNVYENYAHNKPVDTKVDYSYDVTGGKMNTTWNITTQNLNGQANGNTVQGFIPHQYKNTTSSNVSYSGRDYVSARGTLKTAFGTSFSFSYKFGGILPSFTAPYLNAADANGYDANVLYKFVSDFASAKNSYGGDTYWGGKDLVNLAKYTLLAKELNHQSYEKLLAKTREALVDWLTYTSGETAHYFAHYDRWKALIGFDQSYGSAQFTDNHFHYGYLIHAAGLYGMLDDNFLAEYGDMLRLVTQQYANWERDDSFLPYFRTFDPWIGHSYAGGTSSGGGNNQESTSEAMQSWVGMFLLGEVMGDDAMRDAGAFGYVSEAAATMEYWFDWDQENLPEAYPHDIVGILWNGGYSYGTYFSASPVHIHGIQYLPICPGFKYMAENKTWANKEYNDMMSEALETDGHANEIDFGDDWAHVALGFKLLSDPEYVADFMSTNLALSETDTSYIMDYEVSGLTYFYTHAIQNLGAFSFNYYSNFPASSVFENNGAFSHAVVYNSSTSTQTCNIYNLSGGVVASFSVPAKSMYTYPELPTNGQKPAGCYNLTSDVFATSGNASASAAVDGSMGTRWSAESTDPCYFILDLGTKCAISEISISWETASASAYSIEGSNDSINWTVISDLSGLAYGERTDIVNDFTEAYRYVRLYITEPSSPWAYTIYELTVCGEVASDNSNPVTNLALNKSVFVSSIENAGLSGNNAVDGSAITRWSSQYTDDEWIYVDLSADANIESVKITWETAMASNYLVQVSNNASTWNTIASQTGNTNNINEFTSLNAVGRYVRILGQQRATPWGYSIYELEIYGSLDDNPIDAIHIEAEDYTLMNGIQLEATSDAGGGDNVGWIDAGDWMNYTVNVPSSGLYNVSYRIASAPGTGVLNFEVSNQTLASTAIDATGSWQTWQTLSTSVMLTEGSQTIQLYAQSGGFNINWFELEANSAKAGELAQINNKLSDQFSIYPNPFVNLLNIETESPITNVNIFNIDGSLVYTAKQNQHKNKISLDLSTLSQGVYFLQVECDSNIHTQKIINK